MNNTNPRRRRAGNGNPNNRRMLVSARAMRPTTNPTTSVTRKFRLTNTLVLNNTFGGDTVGGKFIGIDPSAYAQTAEVLKGYDFYRITNLKFFIAHSQPSNLASTADAWMSIQQPLYTAATTEVWSMVDYTYSTTTPTTLIQQGANARVTGVPAGRIIKVADFRPKPSSPSSTMVYPADNWVRAGSVGVYWSGLQIWLRNRGGTIVFPNTSEMQRMTIVCELTMEMKQPIGISGI